MSTDQELWQQLQIRLFQKGKQGALSPGGLAPGKAGGCGEGAAGRLLFPLGLWLQDWYTTAFSPSPSSFSTERTHPKTITHPALPHPTPTSFLGAFSHPCLLGKRVTWVLGSYRAVNIRGLHLHEKSRHTPLFLQSSRGWDSVGREMGEHRGRE